MKNLVIYLFATVVLLASCQKHRTMKSASSDSTKLEGAWELNAMTVPGKDFNGLYKEKKPFIKFNLTEKKFSGNTGCNSFGGNLIVTGNRIDFSAPFMMTKMFCPGEGENTFVEALKKINKYSVSDDGTLSFLMDDMATMRFSKQ